MARLISKKLCVCVGLALMILMVVFVAWPPSSPTTKPNIFVLGHTNDPTTGLLFLFSVSNQTESRMPFLIGAPQIKTAGLWPPAPGPHGSGVDLLPHQSTNFAMKAPFEPGVWRVPVFYGYWPSGIERFRAEIRYNMRVNWIRLKHRDLPTWDSIPEVYIYSIYSPEVTAQPNTEPTNATNLNLPDR